MVEELEDRKRHSVTSLCLLSRIQSIRALDVHGVRKRQASSCFGNTAESLRVHRCVIVIAVQCRSSLQQRVTLFFSSVLSNTTAAASRTCDSNLDEVLLGHCWRRAGQCTLLG